NSADAGSPVTQVAVGYGLTCTLLADGSLSCNFGPSVPSGTYTQVSVGGPIFSNGYACAVASGTSAGALGCWGDDPHAETTPPAGTFVQVSAGATHACAVSSTGSIACWGTNAFGESTPPPGSFTEVTAGQFHSCGLKVDGSVVCWGSGPSEVSPPPGTFLHIS